jgi:hypothetical protein
VLELKVSQILLTVMLLSGAAHAQLDGKALFNAGRKAYREGRYEAAADAFETAFRVDHFPGLLYNEAMALRRLYATEPKPATLARAIAVCRRYLDQFPDAPERASVQEELELLSKLVEPVEPKPAPEPPPPKVEPPPENKLPLAPSPYPAEEERPYARGPGKVELRIESAGEPQDVSAEHGSRFRRVCTTPCSLFARPGPLSLQLAGEGLISSMTSVDVPEAGGWVRMRAPTRARQVTSYVFLGGGVASLGVAFFTLLTGGLWSGTASLANSARTMFIVGGTFTVLGAASLTGGLVLYRQCRTGIESRGSF